VTAATLTALAGSILTVVGVVWGVRRQRLADLSDDRRADFDTLMREMRESRKEAQDEARALREENRGIRGELGQVRNEVANLTMSVGRLTSWRAKATAYIHQLRQALEDAGVQVPPEPEGLDL